MAQGLLLLSLLLLPEMPDGFAGAAQPTGSPTPPETMAFNIPSEPLGDAINAYSAVTGIAAFTATKLVAGRRSTAVKGSFDPASALNQLLTNTGLTASYIDGGSFTLVPVVPPANPVAPSDPGDPDDFVAYAATVQQVLVQRLCSNPRTSFGSYRAALEFWIGPSGTIQHPVLVEGSGDQNRDTLLLALIDGLDVGAVPPVDLPQPTSILIVPKGPGGAAMCPAMAQEAVP